MKDFADEKSAVTICQPSKSDGNDTDNLNVTKEDLNSAIDQLVVWTNENNLHDGLCGIKCSIPFDSQESLTSEDKNQILHQCVCMGTIKKLQQILEMTNAEINANKPKSTFHPDFVNLTFDLADDHVGKDLDVCGTEFEKCFDFCSDTADASDGSKYNADNESSKSVKPKSKLKKDYSMERLKKQLMGNRPSGQKSVLRFSDSNVDTDMDYVITNSSTRTDYKAAPKFEKKISTTKAEKKKSKTAQKSKRPNFRRVKPVSVKAAEKKRKEIDYVYTYGDKIRRGGFKYGHKNCVTCVQPVPRNKGWINDRFVHEPIDCRKYYNPDQSYDDDETSGTVEMEDEHKSDDGLSMGKRRKKIIPDPTLMLDKQNGTYTITMNFLTADEKLSPAVFKLDQRSDADAGNASSVSDFNVELVTPNVLNALRQKHNRKDATTVYRSEDLNDDTRPFFRRLRNKK